MYKFADDRNSNNRHKLKMVACEMKAGTERDSRFHLVIYLFIRLGIECQKDFA